MTTIYLYRDGDAGFRATCDLPTGERANSRSTTALSALVGLLDFRLNTFGIQLIEGQPPPIDQTPTLPQFPAPDLGLTPDAAPLETTMKGPPDTAIALMRELIGHLTYDAGVNGSQFTDHPYGTIPLSITRPDHLFARMLSVAGVSTADEAARIAYGPMMEALINRATQDDPAPQPPKLEQSTVTTIPLPGPPGSFHWIMHENHARHCRIDTVNVHWTSHPTASRADDPVITFRVTVFDGIDTDDVSNIKPSQLHPTKEALLATL